MARLGAESLATTSSVMRASHRSTDSPVTLGTMLPWQLLLLTLVARPMLAFALVLATLGKEGEGS